MRTLPLLNARVATCAGQRLPYAQRAARCSPVYARSIDNTEKRARTFARKTRQLCKNVYRRALLPLALAAAVQQAQRLSVLR